MNGQQNNYEDFPSTKIITLKFKTILVPESRVHKIIKALKTTLTKFDLTFIEIKIEED